MASSSLACRLVKLPLACCELRLILVVFQADQHLALLHPSPLSTPIHLTLPTTLAANSILCAATM